MQFHSKQIKNPATVVYGRRKGSKSFDAVLTLEHNNDSTEVHGLLTRDCSNPEPCEYRVSMELQELINFWKYLKEICPTQFIEFDALPDHARFYKQFLYIVNSYVTKTLDGHECEHLTVDMTKGLKHFNNATRD